MKNRRRSVLYATLALLVLVLIGVVAYLSRTPTAVPQSATEAPPTPAPLRVGQSAPDFTVSTTNGPFTLKAMRGKPVLLEVFATWCPHCQRETVALNTLFDQYHERAAFVAVSGSKQAIDGTSPESQADVVNFADHFHVRYPIAFDPDLAVAHAYLQNGFPTVVVVGADGKIRYVSSGEIPQAELQQQLDAALRR